MSHFGHIALTVEQGKVVVFEGNDPYELQRRELKSCMIGIVDTMLGQAVIDRMYILPEERHTGRASEMFEVFLGECLLEGVGRIITQVLTDDPREQEMTEQWVRHKGFIQKEQDLFVLDLTEI